MLKVVLVGRPNVGKSALLNRLTHRTVSIVHDQPGVTRDRISVETTYKDHLFEIVDTGGIGLFDQSVTPKEIATAVEMQTEIAIETADVILVVMDGREGVTPLDLEIIRKLRKGGKHPWLLVNKLDRPSSEDQAAEFFRMGVEPTFPVSASQGRGISELWEALLKGHKDVVGERKAREIESMGPRVAIVGRPNVGKSSLTNRLAGAERVIVSDVPGTTRDAIELKVSYHKTTYQLVDTAGVRSKSKIHDNVEMYSRHSTEKSVARCDLAVLMLQSQDGATRQDREIARMILDYHKPCLILINKWDLNEQVEERREMDGDRVRVRKVKRRVVSRSEYETSLRGYLPFLDYAPMMFVSAVQGYQAQTIWKEIDRINHARKATFSTGILNRIFNRAQNQVQPPMKSGKRLKIYYAIQKDGEGVPTFLLFVNHRNLWVESYGRYLANQLRQEHPLPGCPVVFHLREKGAKTDTEETGGRRHVTRGKAR